MNVGYFWVFWRIFGYTGIPLPPPPPADPVLRFGPCDGVSSVGGGVRKAGFKGGEGVELSFSGFCKIVACVYLGVTLKGLRGVENAAVAVEETCVLDVKSGTVSFSCI